MPACLPSFRDNWIFSKLINVRKGDGRVATEGKEEENYVEGFLIFPIEWILNEWKLTRNLHEFFRNLSEKQTPEDEETTAQVAAYDIYLL